MGDDNSIHPSPANRLAFMWLVTSMAVIAPQIHMGGDNDSIYHSPANKFIHIGGDSDSTANKFTLVCNDAHNIHHSHANGFTFTDSFKQFQSVNSGREKAVVLLCEKYIKQVSCTQCIPKAP